MTEKQQIQIFACSKKYMPVLKDAFKCLHSCTLLHYNVAISAKVLL